MYQPWLTTLDHVRQHRRLAATETDDNPLLQSFIRGISQDFVTALQRTPMPYVMTRLFDYGGEYMKSARKLLLDEDLLAVTTLTNGDDSVVSSDDYVLIGANRYPKFGIRLKVNSGVTWLYDDDPEECISVAGTWGYVPHYATNAWKDSGVNVPAGDMTASATSVELGENEGALFETGQYIRIESETIQVTAISDDTLTLSRGELGTTAAEHAEGEDIETFHQLEDIKAAVRELVAYRYKTKDQIGGRVQVFQGGVLQVQDVDPMVQETVDRHRRVRISGIG